MPVKFDDLSKTAHEVLNDDYQTKGYCFKAKQKTNWEGAVVTTTVDVLQDSVKTPAKLTWKLPTPLGCSAISIDKLEMDKGGKYKLECSSDKVCPCPGIKVEAKSDLVNLAKSKLGITYTGLKDTQLKVEATAMDPTDFVAESTYANGDVTLGAKFTMNTLTAPDLGARYANGPIFASLLVKEQFSLFTAHGFYKVTPEMKCAATYDFGGKKNGSFSLGFIYDLQKGTKLKAKVQQDQSVSCTVKHDVSKGFTVLAGTRYEMQSGKMDTGFQLSIE